MMDLGVVPENRQISAVHASQLLQEVNGVACGEIAVLEAEDEVAPVRNASHHDGFVSMLWLLRYFKVFIRSTPGRRSQILRVEDRLIYLEYLIFFCTLHLNHFLKLLIEIF